MADRARVGVFRGKLKSRQPAAIEPAHVPDFVQVVVFGGHPEDGNGGNACFREFLRDLHRGQRFIKSIGGTTEESNLLAAHDHYRALFQAVEIFLRGGAGPQRFVLAAQGCDYFFATLRGKLKTLCNLLDGVKVWTVRIKTGNTGEIVNESDK